MRTFSCLDRVRVTRQWEPDIRSCFDDEAGLCDSDDCGNPRCQLHGIGDIGQVGTIVGTITDDYGASPQDPAFVVDNDIGMVWPEEIELVSPAPVPGGSSL